MNPFKKYRIDYLLFGSFAGTIAILLILVTWISYSSSTKELINTTSFYQQQLLNEFSKKISAQLLIIEQKALIASRDDKVLDYISDQSGSAEQLSQKYVNVQYNMAQIKYSTPIIQSVHLYVDNPVEQDPKATVYFIPKEDLFKESWYTQIENANTDSMWIGEHQIRGMGGEIPVISYMLKITDQPKNTEAFLLINVRTALIKDYMGANRFLVNADGYPLTVTGDTALLSKAVPYIQQMKGEAGFFQKLEQDGLIVWSKFFYTDIYLIEVTPWQLITKGSVDMALTLLIVGAAALIFALFVTLALSRNFTKPIYLLLKIMNSFSLNFNTKALPYDYENEFGLLFRGYRLQVERIESLYKSLEIQYEQRREAEIQTLQALINPHFLYNTLDQVNWIAIEEGQLKMSKILSLMGKMFRIVLSKGEGMITIRDELTHIQCYLDIQRIRWENRLTYEIAIDPELYPLYIPKLTLQPFVENAVIHGFHERPSGHLTISLLREQDDVLIHIKDDGIGLHAGWNEADRNSMGGYGIRNVKERLDAYFGQPYGIQMNNRSAGGTHVLVQLPALYEKTLIKRGEHFVEDSHY
ncbi:sensor histidine kinase [Paenibacillus thalictri]|uniref:Sensor histidine kinase n=1 Tax=Paenibacillus thalictri TaxID=2527873 RepID=A0A4Q9DQF7_9BACL|nr:histidine kinase [Paenibacillus thalictri]TBL76536.1 sensor histidine kinase [Paenibacillus thalictri]